MALASVGSFATSLAGIGAGTKQNSDPTGSDVVE